jgi:peptidoglycan hydrolase-like protein with peptidoglycan-binding domain
MSTAAPERRQCILHGAITNENVRLAQLALPEAGFDPGEIDGVYGFHTARNVGQFQHGERPDQDRAPLGTVTP